MAELVASRERSRGVEERQPGRRARAAGRAVDLSVGEDGHVSLGQRLALLLLPEDDPVDVAQLLLDRVNDLVLRLEAALDRPAELDQPRQLAGLDPLPQRGVEGAAERDVDRDLSHPNARRPDERRDVAKRDRADAAADDGCHGFEPARGNVDDDPVLSLAALHDALVERPRDESDRPVTARRRVAGVVEEHDAEVGAVVVRRHDVAAVHVGVAARLVDEQPADVVEPLERVAASLEDRRAPERLDAAGDDPKRLATGVVVDRPDRGQPWPSPLRRR